MGQRIPSFFSSIQQAITEHLTIQQLCIEDIVVKKSWEVPSSYALYVLLWETEINSLKNKRFQEVLSAGRTRITVD